jgi:secreted PhoX family phosphatase
VPAVTLTSTQYGTKNLLSSFENPDGLAFDSLGDLWVANTLQPRAGGGSGSLVEFTPSELTTSGSPQPVRAILSNWFQTNISSPDYMTFGPALP